MKKSTKTILIAILVFVAIIILGTLVHLMPVIDRNPDGFLGNTASNLYNGGTFCEYNGKVYFSNSSDNNALYVMNPDETEVQKISSSAVLSINVDDHRIYYSIRPRSKGPGLGYMKESAGLYSITHKGNKAICYTPNPVAVAFLYGNKLYYQAYRESHGSTVFSITTEREGNQEIVAQMATLVDAYNGNIYYGGMGNDHYLYALDPSIDVSDLYLEIDMYRPIVERDWIYYIDPTDNYSLKRYSIEMQTVETLCEDRIEFFNIYDDFIYYQKNSPAALCRMNRDGSEDFVVTEGIYCDLQTTSEYVYFRSFEQQAVTYHANHYGLILVEPFYPSRGKE